MRLAQGVAIATATTVLALAVGVTACGSTDVVVALIPCSSSNDCGPDSVCSQTSCDSPVRTCEPLRDCSSSSDTIFNPERGCSGTYYWNACIRQQHGEAKSGGADGGPGDCGGLSATPQTCSSSTNNECDAGSYCSPYLCPIANDPRAPIGICLVLPEQCPPTSSVTFPNGFMLPTISACTCAIPHTAMDYCTAVRNGTPVVPSTMPGCQP
ncbi:MAG: hypothetical protein ACRENE_06770 [Polyangiaceae bacterium]